MPLSLFLDLVAAFHQATSEVVPNGPPVSSTVHRDGLILGRLQRTFQGSLVATKPQLRDTVDR